MTNRTLSLFLQFLTNSNYIYVNDVYGNVYEVLGIVSAQSDYDVVVLKISEEVGKKVVLGKSDSIKSGDKVFTINRSKSMIHSFLSHLINRLYVILNIS